MTLNFLSQLKKSIPVAWRLADPEIEVHTPPGYEQYEYIFWTNWTSLKPGLIEDHEFVAV